MTSGEKLQVLMRGLEFVKSLPDHERTEALRLLSLYATWLNRL